MSERQFLKYLLRRGYLLKIKRVNPTGKYFLIYSCGPFMFSPLGTVLIMGNNRKVTLTWGLTLEEVSSSAKTFDTKREARRFKNILKRDLRKKFERLWNQIR